MIHTQVHKPDTLSVVIKCYMYPAPYLPSTNFETLQCPPSSSPSVLAAGAAEPGPQAMPKNSTRAVSCCDLLWVARCSSAAVRGCWLLCSCLECTKGLCANFKQQQKLELSALASVGGLQTQEYACAFLQGQSAREDLDFSGDLRATRHAQLREQKPNVSCSSKLCCSLGSQMMIRKMHTTLHGVQCYLRGGIW